MYGVNTFRHLPCITVYFPIAAVKSEWPLKIKEGRVTSPMGYVLTDGVGLEGWRVKG